MSGDEVSVHQTTCDKLAALIEANLSKLIRPCLARRGLCTNALSQLSDIPTVWHDIVTVVLLWYFRSYALVLLVKHSMEACVYVLRSSIRSEK